MPCGHAYTYSLVQPKETKCRPGMRSHIGSENKMQSAGPHRQNMAHVSLAKLLLYV